MSNNIFTRVTSKKSSLALRSWKAKEMLDLKSFHLRQYLSDVPIFTNVETFSTSKLKVENLKRRTLLNVEIKRRKPLNDRMSNDIKL